MVLPEKNPCNTSLLRLSALFSASLDPANEMSDSGG